MPLRSGAEPKAARAATGDADGAPPAKKPRASKLESAQTKQKKAQAKLQALNVRTASLQHALNICSPATKAAREEALQTHLENVAAQKLQLEQADQAVKAAEDADAAKKLKETKAAATAEQRKVMTVKAIRHLVVLRLEKQKFMDDKSNKNAKIWGEITDAYNALVDTKELPESDRRSMESLKAKFSTLDGSFKQHCRAIQRRKESGASEEDVGAPCRCPRAMPLPPSPPAPAAC